jgi:site-specific DNA-cytosine methylase
MLETFAASIGPSVDLVVAAGGSPCQDLFSLLADKAGLQGMRSKLFVEMPRIFEALKQVFRCPVYRFVENVFSMTAEDRDKFSTTLGIEPILLDSAHFSPCKRSRLFWVDSPVDPGWGESLHAHHGYKEWIGKATAMTGKWWLDPFCSRASNDPLPTFTRALLRKTPPREPAGVQSASAGAIERWKADHFRFQVY